MSLEDQYKLLIESYYGILIVDEYDLKEYVLKQIEKLIIDFENNYENIDYNKIREYVKNNVEVKTKLQSSLITLNSIDADIELILLIKDKIKELKW